MEVAAGVKRDKKKGKTIRLTLKDSEFRSHVKSNTLSEATDDPETIYMNACRLYEANYLGMMTRLVGVALDNLVDPHEETVQMNFWNYGEYEKLDKTKLLVNELNRKMDKPALLLASEAKKKDGNS